MGINLDRDLSAVAISAEVKAPQYYQVLILVDSGIGNALEALYALEYCLRMGVKAAIFLNTISASFQNYLARCYSADVILKNLNEVSAEYLLHSFTFEDRVHVNFSKYFYINPDKSSSYYLSETEQYLSIVQSIYPGGEVLDVLSNLVADYSTKVKFLKVESKVVLYPGSAWFSPVKRWPYYFELEKILPADKVVFVGGQDDLNVEASNIYPFFIAAIVPQKLLNNYYFWRLCRLLGVLKSHAHNTRLKLKDNAFVDVFDWAELVAIFRSCRGFVGNDGGLSHLAACAGARGLVLFGPTSVAKNKPISKNIHSINKALACSPCQFSVGHIPMQKKMINCPYGVKCLNDISAVEVLGHVKNVFA